MPDKAWGRGPTSVLFADRLNEDDQHGEEAWPSSTRLAELLQSCRSMTAESRDVIAATRTAVESTKETIQTSQEMIRRTDELLRSWGTLCWRRDLPQ
jgi:hypothetical protein